MGIDAAIEYADQMLYERTGKHLSDLQSCIIQESWQGRTYSQVASQAGYSEGHVKDVASQLWRQLSDALGERITKGNLRSRLLNRLKRTVKSATPASLHPLMSSSAALVSAAIAPEASPVAAGQTHPWPQLFQALPAPASASFVGRGAALQALQQRVQTYHMVVVQGEGGIGKTTLAQQFCQRFGRVLELLMAKERGNITPVESVVEEWLRQAFDEEPGREFGVTLARLKHHLSQLSPQASSSVDEPGQQMTMPIAPIVVLIDNLEPALDGNGQFIQGHRRYVELLRVLASSGVPVVMTSRDRLCEPSLPVHHYRLPGLTVAAWQQFFEAHPVRLQGDVLQPMHRAYGGNAKAMELLCAAAVEDFEGDVQAYWQENEGDLLGAADVRNLVASQVNRLQQLDEAAYQVFCRLGCYRYQERPTLPAKAVEALMWDVPPERRRKLLNSLRDRSLLESRKGRYWLHPVSRAEAIRRLRQGEEWHTANRAAAQYWGNSVQAVVSVEDALKALEGYYHLMAIADYEAAATVLLNSRHNQWRQFLPLASSLYRMGLLRPAISAITQVLPHLKASQFKGVSELNNILGDVYWITGKIHSAIACQQKTLRETEVQLENLMAAIEPRPGEAETAPLQVPGSQAEGALRPNAAQGMTDSKEAYYLKMLTVDAHLSIGLYAIDLWELEQAATQFDQVIALATGGAHQAWADKAMVGLALVRAYQGEHAAAMALAHLVQPQLTTGPACENGRYAYFLQMLGQTFSALSDLDQAQGLYEQAIASAEVGHYVQVQAKALTGLAVLKRQQGKGEQAIALHAQATALCEKIGAQCDLAEAYFQLGLSVHAEAGGTPPHRYRADCDRAIALFSAIQAPQQVNRVKSAMARLST